MVPTRSSFHRSTFLLSLCLLPLFHTSKSDQQLLRNQQDDFTFRKSNDNVLLSAEHLYHSQPIQQPQSVIHNVKHHEVSATFRHSRHLLKELVDDEQAENEEKEGTIGERMSNAIDASENTKLNDQNLENVHKDLEEDIKEAAIEDNKDEKDATDADTKKEPAEGEKGEDGDTKPDAAGDAKTDDEVPVDDKPVIPDNGNGDSAEVKANGIDNGNDDPVGDIKTVDIDNEIAAPAGDDKTEGIDNQIVPPAGDDRTDANDKENGDPAGDVKTDGIDNQIVPPAGDDKTDANSKENGDPAGDVKTDDNGNSGLAQNLKDETEKGDPVTAIDNEEAEKGDTGDDDKTDGAGNEEVVKTNPEIVKTVDTNDRPPNSSSFQKKDEALAPHIGTLENPGESANRNSESPPKPHTVSENDSIAPPAGLVPPQPAMMNTTTSSTNEMAPAEPPSAHMKSDEIDNADAKPHTEIMNSEGVYHSNVQISVKDVLTEEEEKQKNKAFEEETKKLEEENAEIDELIKKAHSVLSDDEKATNSTDISERDMNVAKEFGLNENDIDDMRRIRKDPHAAIAIGGVRSRSSDSRRMAGDIPEMLAAEESAREKQNSKGQIISDAVRAVGGHIKYARSDDTDTLAQHQKIGSKSMDSLQVGEFHSRDSVALTKEKWKLAHQVKNLTSLLSRATDEILKYKLREGKERNELQNSVEAVSRESKEEIMEMRTTIEEQKRAFDELLEEKKLITKVLQDEEAALKELQNKIQHPDFAIWIRNRAKRISVFRNHPEADALTTYAKLFMAPQVDKIRHRLEYIERNIEQKVDHLLPARYGWFVAIILSVCIVGFPLFIVTSTFVSVSTSMSLKQYVLVGNIFLTAMTIAICFTGLLLRQDPLQTLYEAGRELFIMMQIGIALSFPCFVLILGMATLQSTDRIEQVVFGCQFLFYILAGMNYHSHVWGPVMLGQNIGTSAMMYLVFLIDFLAMTMLTISIARLPDGTHTSVDSASWDLESNGAAKMTNGSAGTGKINVQSPWVGTNLGAGLKRSLNGIGETEKTE